MLKTFRIGGIHPKENKISAGRAIQQIEIPEQVIIPLSQHIGAPCQPIVKKGDKVKVGTQIGKSVGYVSANIHSSVSGTILKIDKALDSSGYKRDAVFKPASTSHNTPLTNSLRFSIGVVGIV